MRLFILFVSLSICHAKVVEVTHKKVDEILPAITSLASGTPDDWNDRDRSAFDQFLVDVVRGKLLTITEELSKLKKRSIKAFNLMNPLALYFKNGYDKLKSVEGRQFFVTELPALTSNGIGFGDMMSVAFNFWQMSDEAKDEIYRTFPEVFE